MQTDSAVIGGILGSAIDLTTMFLIGFRNIFVSKLASMENI